MLRIYSIGIAFVLDMIFGDPYDFPHPVRYIGSLIHWLDVNLRKVFRSNRGLVVAGLILAVGTIGLTFALTFAVMYVAFRLHPWVGVSVEGFILYTTFSVKCLKEEALKIYRTLRTSDLDSSRKALSYIVGRDTAQLSREEIVRAVVETVAENTVDGFIAPLFYAFLGGAPLAMAYKAANTLDSMVGYKNDKYYYMGFFSAKIDDVFNFIPARLSVIPFTAAAMVLRRDWRSAFRISLRDRKNHKSPNCAYSEGAVAGALGIQLGGTNMYFGKPVEKPTIGDRKREIEAEDIPATCSLMVAASMISVLLGVGIYYLC